MKRFLLPVLAASALATGCFTHGDVGGGYSYGYASASAGPDLYYMSPGVSVVAYSEYPTFYSDNSYWRYQDGLWYRSGYYGGGWAVSYDVPYHVRSIDRPTTYTRFQPGRGWVRMHGGGGSGGTRYNANTTAPAPAYGGRSRGTPAARPSGKSGGSWTPPPSRGNSGTYTAPRSGGSGPTVRDHRRR